MDYKKYDIEILKQQYPILDIANRLGIDVKNNFAKCIKHKPDNNPSLSFNTKENYCKCFSCNYTADIFELVKDVRNCNFHQAIAFITNDNSQIKHTQTNQNKKAEHKSTQQKVIETTKSNLDNSIIYKMFLDLLDKTEAVEYLVKRCLTKSIVDKHSIKNLPSTFDNQNKIKNKLIQEFGINKLKESGLVNEKSNLVFLYHRLIIPYFDIDKNIICLQARHIDNNQDIQSKYLFTKTKQIGLYNIENITVWGKGSTILICEGVIDCLSFERLGIHTIAVPGTQSINLFNNEIMDLLKNYNIIVFGDNDKAGNKFNFNLFRHFYNNRSIEIQELNFSEELASKITADYKNINDVNDLLIKSKMYTTADFDFIQLTNGGMFILDKDNFIEIDKTELEIILKSKDSKASMLDVIRIKNTLTNSKLIKG